MGMKPPVVVNVKKGECDVYIEDAPWISGGNSRNESLGGICGEILQGPRGLPDMLTGHHGHP